MVEIKRVAATFREPSISIEFRDENGKLNYRRFPVAFSYFTNPEAFYKTLITDYPDYFNEQSIKPEKLRNFVDTIIQKSPKLDLAYSTKEEIDRFKQQMNREFEMNVIKRDDPNYVYDVQEDFEQGEGNFDWD